MRDEYQIISILHFFFAETAASDASTQCKNIQTLSATNSVSTLCSPKLTYVLSKSPCAHSVAVSIVDVILRAFITSFPQSLARLWLGNNAHKRLGARKRVYVSVKQRKYSLQPNFNVRPLRARVCVFEI